MIDQTITVGNIIEIGTIFVGGVVAFIALRGTVSILGKDVVELKTDIKAINKIVVSMAVADQRITAVESDLRELRHGRGFIREAIEKVYP